MKISGFTFVKNAIKFGYPVIESTTSILPIVDEMVVCVGDSEDETTKLIENIASPKIKLLYSVWDSSLKTGGRVLAVETDKALQATCGDSDWLFYIQADEVLHEQYHSTVLKAMQQYKDDKNVEGLLFHYHHFYGSYKYIGDGRRWYSKEIRVVRNNKDIRSYRDAQGFRWKNNTKLKVKLIDAYIYHYGWARNPVIMHQKSESFDKLWHGEKETNEGNGRKQTKQLQFDYSSIDSVMVFEGTHPQVMKELIAGENWNFETDSKKKNFKNIEHRILYFLSSRFGWRPFEYSNYKRI